jgi:serine/threonine protein phosphatase 1
VEEWGSHGLPRAKLALRAACGDAPKSAQPPRGARVALTMENYVAIGDIHGRFDLLERLLSDISDEVLYEHKLVFLGDMVDRGPASYDVVGKVKQLCDDGKAIALLGNHDDFMLDYHRGRIVDKQNIWFYGGNGGKKTVESYTAHYGEYGQGRFFSCFEKSGHAAWMKSLPYFYETEKVWFSHAPIPGPEHLHAIRPFDGDYRANKEVLTWTYREHSPEGTWEHNHGKLAVCGHVHGLQRKLLEPRVYQQFIY